MRITLIRHGETDYNAEKRIQGHTDIPLNEKGRGQAAQIAEALKTQGIKFDAAISSDLSRARETGKIALPANFPLTFKANLRERWMGELEGVTLKEAQHMVARSETKKTFMDYGESERQLIDRGLSAWDEIIRDSKRAGHKNVVIFSHGGFLRILIENLVHTKRVNPGQFAGSTRGSLANCSLSIIEDGEIIAYNLQIAEALVPSRDAL